MSDQNSSWPFGEDVSGEGLNFDAIFGGGSAASDVNPFDIPAAQTAQTEPVASTAQLQTAEIAAKPEAIPVAAPAPMAMAPAEKQEIEPIASAAEVPNPIEAAFTQKAVENTQKGLLEKPPSSATRM